MSVLLTCSSLSKHFGPRLLFSDISISFAEGERIGLVGPNGSGKSTLLKILAGLEHADTGEITTKRNLRLAYLPQESTFPDNLTVEQVMLAAMKDVHLDEHDKLTQIAILLGKLGFANFDQLANTLSGGWRKRLAIASQLILDPELLLLDEPTNHLDLEGILWLEDLLQNASFAYIVVSHDRYFLENVSNRTIDFSRAYPQGYLSINGPYSYFLEKREEFMEAQQAHQQALQSRVHREIEWLRRGAKARTTKAKGRIEQAGNMMNELADLKSRNARQQAAEIDFTASGRQTRKLVAAKNISKSLGGKPLFSNLDLVLSPRQRLGLLGPNGSGKSTLLKILAGEMPPDSGEIKQAEALRVVRFDQNREQLDRTITLKRALSPKSDTVIFQGQSMHISGWARKFLFRTEQLDMPVSDLSGGEQARVLIARLMLQEADLLILDEPTNDLDIPTLEVLEESLEDFPGALVLVTHDRYMLDRLSTDLLGLDGFGHARMFGDLTQWQRWQDEQVAAATAPKTKEKPKEAAPAPKPAKKKLTWNEQREWEQMEAKIMQAEADVEKWQQAISDPAVAADRNRMHEACHNLGAAQDLVRHLYDRWAQLEEKQRG